MDLNSLTSKKHKHEWTEQNNYLICNTCRKKKLKLIKENNSDILLGTKSDGTIYKVRSNRDRIFNPEEWELFYNNLTEEQMFTFKFLLITGARINEANHVKVEDIDIPNQRIVLRVTKQRHGDNVINKSKTRTIRVSKDLIKDIKRVIENNKLSKEDYLGILSQPACHIAMKGDKKSNRIGALEKAKIKDWEMLSVHNVRKTSENWALATGVDSMKLSTRFGHNMTTQYEHYSQSDAFTLKEKVYIKDFFGDTFID